MCVCVCVCVCPTNLCYELVLCSSVWNLCDIVQLLFVSSSPAPVAFVDGYGENYGDSEEGDRFDFFFMFFHENAFEIRVGDAVS